MVSDPKDEKHNVVELAKVRKQMQTLRAKDARDSNGKEPLKDYKNKGRTPLGSRSPGAKASKRGIWDYIQLVLFLAMGAYMLQLCSGGGGLPGL